MWPSHFYFNDLVRLTAENSRFENVYFSHNRVQRNGGALSTSGSGTRTLHSHSLSFLLSLSFHFELLSSFLFFLIFVQDTVFISSSSFVSNTAGGSGGGFAVENVRIERIFSEFLNERFSVF
jgi:predicted outer membrane repeat protein